MTWIRRCFSFSSWRLSHLLEFRWVVIISQLVHLVTHDAVIRRLLVVLLPRLMMILGMVLLLLLLFLLLLLLLLVDLLLPVLGNAILDDVKMSQNIIFGGRQFVGMLEAGLRLQQSPTFHVDDA